MMDAWQKESCREAVRFHLRCPLADARDAHEMWMERKLREGWRYGPVKNAETKEHPCLLPRRCLPAIERAKDNVFLAVVHGYVSAMREAHGQ